MYTQGEDPKDSEEESEQYQWGYLHAIDEVKRKIQLRSRDVVFNKGKLNLNQPSTSLQDDDRNKEKSKGHFPCKEPVNKGEKVKEVRPPAPTEVEKVMPSFNLQWSFLLSTCKLNSSW